MNQYQPLENLSVVRVELVKDWLHPYANREVDTPKDLAAVLREFLAKADREVFPTVNLSGTNEINSINVVSVGCLTRTIVEPREVFKAAILSNAHSFEKPIPSDKDIKITKNLIRCGNILDHQNHRPHHHRRPGIPKLCRETNRRTVTTFVKTSPPLTAKN